MCPVLLGCLITADPQARTSGRHYLRIVGPAYGFFGVAMALYFASQGTGEMYWPVAANLTRITIAAGGSLLALDQFGWGVSGLYACIGIGVGDPDQLTVQAVQALNRTDVFFVMDKGPAKTKLRALREEILRRHAKGRIYRVAEA